MSSDEDTKPGVIGVATGGIQDVSALLPILGTEQCEHLVTSALQHGLLYAAATPISVFGSLGIVKAGFVVLMGSIDHRRFPGPVLLLDAGYKPTGMGELLVPTVADKKKLYIAEDKIRGHLSRFQIQSVDVNLFSKDLWMWNLELVGTTLLLSSLGLLPYIYLIERSLPNAPFRTTWIYPVMRILGCDMVAISIQVIFQLRALEEVYYRLRFLATDSYLKDHGKSFPNFWDPHARSKSVLSQLRHSNLPSSHDFNTSPLSFDQVGKLASFQVPLYEASFKGIGDSLKRDHGHQANESIAEKAGSQIEAKSKASFYRLHKNHYFISLLLWTARASLLFGLGLSVVGYIGCFSVVQASPRADAKGPLIWLLVEAALAAIRTLIWALNPELDDAPSPIVLQKVTSGPNVDNTGNNGSSYGIGWTLETVTANDMHAVLSSVT
jgi:hypothetical protein